MGGAILPAVDRVSHMQVADLHVFPGTDVERLRLRRDQHAGLGVHLPELVIRDEDGLNGRGRRIAIVINGRDEIPHLNRFDPPQTGSRLNQRAGGEAAGMARLGERFLECRFGENASEALHLLFGWFAVPVDPHLLNCLIAKQAADPRDPCRSSATRRRAKRLFIRLGGDDVDAPVRPHLRQCPLARADDARLPGEIATEHRHHYEQRSQAKAEPAAARARGDRCFVHVTFTVLPTSGLTPPSPSETEK